MDSLHENYANQLFDLYESTKATSQRLVRELSKYDRNLSAFYHDVETKCIAPAEAPEYMKALQCILLKRRVIKQEMHQIDIIERSLRTSIEALETKRYKAFRRIEKYNRSLILPVTISDVLHD